MTIFCVQRVGEQKSQSIFVSKELEGENRNLFLCPKSWRVKIAIYFLIPKSWRAKIAVFFCVQKVEE